MRLTLHIWKFELLLRLRRRDEMSPTVIVVQSPDAQRDISEVVKWL